MFPFGVRAEREILHRCANGRVYDLLLVDMYIVNGSNSQHGSKEEKEKFESRICLLDQVKDSDSIAHGGYQTSSVRREENISLAVHCSK